MITIRLLAMAIGLCTGRLLSMDWQLPKGVDCMILSYMATPDYGYAAEKEWDTRACRLFDKRLVGFYDTPFAFCVATVQAVSQLNCYWNTCINTNLKSIVLLLRSQHSREDEGTIIQKFKKMRGAKTQEFVQWADAMAMKLSCESWLYNLAGEGTSYLEQVKEELIDELSSQDCLDQPRIEETKQLTIAGFIQLLVDNGVDINAQHKYSKKTALDNAIHANQEEVATELVEQGAYIILLTNGSMPLVNAAEGGKNKLLRLMLSKCKQPNDINRQNWRGDTALIVAARGGNKEGMQILLAAGADPLIQNKDGFTAANVPRNEIFL